MIKVNDSDYPWEKGLTIDGLLNTLKDDERFSYLIKPAATVLINDIVIHREEYGTCLIDKGDSIKLVFIIAGG